MSSLDSSCFSLRFRCRHGSYLLARVSARALELYGDVSLDVHDILGCGLAETERLWRRTTSETRPAALRAAAADKR